MIRSYSKVSLVMLRCYLSFAKKVCLEIAAKPADLFIRHDSETGCRFTIDRTRYDRRGNTKAIGERKSGGRDKNDKISTPEKIPGDFCFEDINGPSRQ